MKKFDIKQLYNNKIYWNFFLIGISLFTYLIILLVMKSGYDYQRVVEIKNKQPVEKFKEYSYEIKINNENFKTIEYSSEKNLFSIIESIDKLNVSYISYYEGYEITNINQNPNFKIFVNDQEIESRFFSESEPLVPEKSEIEITF